MDLSFIKKKTLLYIDNFKGGVSCSNQISLKFFRDRYKQVVPIQMRWINPLQMRYLIWRYKPDHIHYGGSIKRYLTVTLATYKLVHEQYPNIFQTILYGDAYTSHYLQKRVEYVNAANQSDAFYEKEKVFWFPATFHMTAYDEYFSDEVPWDQRPYDIVFCGNNRFSNREKILIKLRDAGFKVHVFGNKWEEMGLINHGHCSILESYKVYKHAKLVIGVVSDEYCSHTGFGVCVKERIKDYIGNPCDNTNCSMYLPKQSCVSNRVLIAAYSGTPVLMSYQNELERLLNLKDECVLVDIENLIERVSIFLTDPEQSIQMGKKARKAMKKFSFESLFEKYWSYYKGPTD